MEGPWEEEELSAQALQQALTCKSMLVTGRARVRREKMLHIVVHAMHLCAMHLCAMHIGAMHICATAYKAWVQMRHAMYDFVRQSRTSDLSQQGLQKACTW